MPTHWPGPLCPEQVERFIEDGFVHIEGAFSSELADAAVDRMWRDIPMDRSDRTTWTSPVVRLPGYGGYPFNDIVNSATLHGAFDQLVGPRRWKPRDGIGTIPVRFPSVNDANDTGWHIDVSFPGPAGNQNETRDFSSWRVNVTSRGRALLMLVLFSDVDEADAPTRIRVGSHLEMARHLAPAGEAGLSGETFGQVGEHCSVGLATGPAGTVYLCHPFLVHAAQAHRGSRPRFMGQPGLDLAQPYTLHRPDNDYSPVERAIRLALEASV